MTSGGTSWKKYSTTSNSGERPSSLGQRGARLRLAGVVPPLAGGLARARDHRGEEDEQVDGAARADDRGAEPGQRLGHEDEVRAVTDGVDDGLDVGVETGRVVGSGQLDGDDVVTAPAQLRLDAVPEPRVAAGTGDEPERRHALQSARCRADFTPTVRWRWDGWMARSR